MSYTCNRGEFAPESYNNLVGVGNKQSYSIHRVILFLAFSFLTFSCNRTSLTPEINAFTEKYAGNYTVELDHFPSGPVKEIYVLKYDGTAKWLFVEAYEQVALVPAKVGTWKASNSTLTITCQGKQRVETEQFVLKGNRFYDQATGERYLELAQLARVPF